MASHIFCYHIGNLCSNNLCYLFWFFSGIHGIIFIVLAIVIQIHFHIFIFMGNM
jgi:hypothetical protein